MPEGTEESSAPSGGVGFQLALFIAWLTSCKSPAIYEDDLVDKAIKYLLFLEDHGGNVERGTKQPYTAHFRHYVRKKGWKLVKSNGEVVGLSSPGKEGEPDKIIIPKSKIAETISKYHVREHTHTAPRRCFEMVFLFV